LRILQTSTHSQLEAAKVWRILQSSAHSQLKASHKPMPRSDPLPQHATPTAGQATPRPTTPRLCTPSLHTHTTPRDASLPANYAKTARPPCPTRHHASPHPATPGQATPSQATPRPAPPSHDPPGQVRPDMARPRHASRPAKAGHARPSNRPPIATARSRAPKATGHATPRHHDHATARSLGPPESLNVLPPRLQPTMDADKP